MDARWYRCGRAYAWLNGACYLAASVLFLLVELHLTTPAPPDVAGAPASAAQLAERWAAISAYQRAIWWQLFATDLLYVVGFLALLPLGLALLAQAADGLGGLLGATVVYRLVILVGGVALAPLWSFWLGRELGRAARRPGPTGSRRWPAAGPIAGWSARWLRPP